jgi:hypothetical protein
MSTSQENLKSPEDEVRVNKQGVVGAHGLY